MGKNVIKEPREIFDDIVEDFTEAFGEDLESIVLYGSAAGPAYRPGKSDINFMIVLSEEGIESLDRAFTVVRKWRKRSVAIPLVLTEDYIRASLDVYPIEYLNFQRSHVLVYGKDPLAALDFDRDRLRLQCEREVKGKLLLMREAYLETEGKAKGLQALMERSIGAFLAVFEATLYLGGLPIPEGKREIIRSASGFLGLESDVFESVYDTAGGRNKPDRSEIETLFKDYMSMVRKLSKHIDSMEEFHE